MDFNSFKVVSAIKNTKRDYDYLQSVDKKVTKELNKLTDNIYDKDLRRLIRLQNESRIRDRIAKKERLKLLEQKRIREDQEYRENRRISEEYKNKSFPDRFCLYMWNNAIRFFDILRQEEIFKYDGTRLTKKLKASLIRTYATSTTPILIFYYESNFRIEEYLTVEGKKKAVKITRNKTTTKLLELNTTKYYGK